MAQVMRRSPRWVSTASVERLPFPPVVASLVGHVLLGFFMIAVAMVSSARIDGSRRFVVNLVPPTSRVGSTVPHGSAGGASLRGPAPPARTPSVPSPPVPSVREGGPAPPSLAQVPPARELLPPASSRADIAPPALSIEVPPPRPPEPSSPPRAPDTPRAAASQPIPTPLAAAVPGLSADSSAHPTPPDPATAHSRDTSARLDVADFPFTYYLRQIQAKISERWAPPPAPARGGERAVILFEIGRDGQVNAPVLEQSSGDAVYDESALRAVAEAGPFPPLPAEFKAASLRVHFGFAFQPDRS